MASFTYETHSAQLEAKRSLNPNGGLGPQVHFANEFLKNDGDSIVVRFPYKTMADISYETTHAVTFPGKRYPSRVRCSGDAMCPFCAQGVKIDTRFFAKFITYMVDETTNQVVLVNTVWDRPSAFADIDIKNLMAEYGDISTQLFKIKRNGSGTATKYTISIVLNAVVYSPTIYKADFTELSKVDASKILSKSIAQYNEALNPTVQPQTAQVAQTTQPVYQNVQAQPAYQNVQQNFKADAQQAQVGSTQQSIYTTVPQTRSAATLVNEAVATPSPSVAAYNIPGQNPVSEAVTQPATQQTPSTERPRQRYSF